MGHKLNYRELIKSWMRFYGMKAELSKQIFKAICIHLQAKAVDKKEDKNGQ